MHSKRGGKHKRGIRISPRKIAKFKNNLLNNRNNRKLNERYFEALVRRRYGFSKHHGTAWDADDTVGNRGRIEIKVGRAKEENTNQRTYGSLLEEIMDYEDILPSDVLVSSDEITDRENIPKFKASFQNLNFDNFDTLVYIMVFSDGVQVFEISADNLLDSQSLHRKTQNTYQFVVDEKTYKENISMYGKEMLSWKQFYKEMAKKEDC